MVTVAALLASATLFAAASHPIESFVGDDKVGLK